MTPLLMYVYNNYCNLEMARLILNAGANVNAVDMTGDNALHMITKGAFCYRNVTTEEQTAVARLLVDSGIDLNAKDGSGATALHLAIRKDMQDIVTYILAQGLSTPV